MKRGAVISDCKRYRYSLWRGWDDRAPQMIIIGLNPSTADQAREDPTIRRCISFSRGLGASINRNPPDAFGSTRL